MSYIIDGDAGDIINGNRSRSIQEVADFILDYIIEVASGRIISKADLLNQDDFIPWKRGVSL